MVREACPVNGNKSSPRQTEGQALPSPCISSPLPIVFFDSRREGSPRDAGDVGFHSVLEKLMRSGPSSVAFATRTRQTSHEKTNSCHRLCIGFGASCFCPLRFSVPPLFFSSTAAPAKALQRTTGHPQKARRLVRHAVFSRPLRPVLLPDRFILLYLPAIPEASLFSRTHPLDPQERRNPEGE